MLRFGFSAEDLVTADVWTLRCVDGLLLSNGICAKIVSAGWLSSEGAGASDLSLGIASVVCCASPFRDVCVEDPMGAADWSIPLGAVCVDPI